MSKTVINNNTSSGGISFVGLLTILFIALKLTGMIQWSWLWVVSPIWISLTLWVAILMIALIITGIGLFISSKIKETKIKITKNN